jgi:hypothetical protein
MPDESTFRKVINRLDPARLHKSGENNLTLGELATDEKSKGNEVATITAVPELPDMLDIKGDVVTADAMSCQTAIVNKIREKEADAAT